MISEWKGIWEGGGADSGIDGSLCCPFFPELVPNWECKPLSQLIPVTLSSRPSRVFHHEQDGGCQQVPAPSPAAPEGRASLCAINSAELTNGSRQGQARWKSSDGGHSHCLRRRVDFWTGLHLRATLPAPTPTTPVVEDVGSSPHCISTISLSS